MRVQVEQQSNGKFSVVDADAKGKKRVLQADVETEDQARALVPEFEPDQDDDQKELPKSQTVSPQVAAQAKAETVAPEAEEPAADEKPKEEVTEDNPLGLEAHARIALIHKVLAKHGFYINEAAHPAQHPFTGPGNLANEPQR